MLQAENNLVKLMVIRRHKLKGLSICAQDAGAAVAAALSAIAVRIFMRLQWRCTSC
jgi:hypothetical protein